MTETIEVALLCSLIELAIIKGSLNPHQLTELYELVRERPYQHVKAITGLSTVAKNQFRLYCCLQGQYHIEELKNHQNSAEQLVESATRLIEIGTILHILGGHHATDT